MNLAEIAVLSQGILNDQNKKSQSNPTLCGSQMEQKEWEIIKDYDIHYKWDSFLYTAERFQTYAQAKQFIYENK